MSVNLLAAMNAEYAASKGWLSASLALGIVFYFGSVAGALSSGRSADFLAVLGFLVQLATVVCRRQSGVRYALGESVRRPAMLENGLGITPSALQIANIAARLGIAPPEQGATLGQYYEAPHPQATSG